MTSNNPEQPAGIPGRRWWIAVACAAAATIVITLASLLLVRFIQGPGEEPAMVEVPANFVDTAQSQNHELVPASGDFHGVSGMTMTIHGQIAAIDPVQLTDTGMLIPPTDIQRLGWYSASAFPGAEGNVGSTVITGHVNHEGQGDGYARMFTDLRLGDRFTVAVDGQPRDYEVTEAPYRLTKGAPLPAVVNAMEGPNQLVLITCGGHFVGGQLGYADNIITVATPR